VILYFTKIRVDANIHSTETCAGVAACYLIHYLLDGFTSHNKLVLEALRTRTFYIVPRVNPDGVEAALANRPTYLRSSVRKWPWPEGMHKWPGLQVEDIDGDGRVLCMRILDSNGAWVEHPKDSRVMIPVDHTDSPFQATEFNGDIRRYRILTEGFIDNFDGFTIPTPRKSAGLDLNRLFYINMILIIIF